MENIFLPQRFELLADATLVRTISEYEKVIAQLSSCDTPAFERMRQEILYAVDVIWKELDHRGHRVEPNLFVHGS